MYTVLIEMMQIVKKEKYSRKCKRERFWFEGFEEGQRRRPDRYLQHDPEKIKHRYSPESRVDEATDGLTEPSLLYVRTTDHSNAPHTLLQVRLNTIIQEYR